MYSAREKFAIPTPLLLIVLGGQICSYISYFATVSKPEDNPANRPSANHIQWPEAAKSSNLPGFFFPKRIP